MSVGSNREGTRADSDLGVGLTDSAPSPYSRAAVSIGARRCAPLRFEIIEDERTADDTGSAQDDTSSREMIGDLEFLLASSVMSKMIESQMTTPWARPCG